MRVRNVAFTSVVAGTLVLMMQPGVAMATTFKVLHSFTGGADGGQPQSGLILDGKGKLYGTALQGGANSKGVVFSISAKGTEKVLHSFGGGDGAYPWSALQAKSGKFYGSTVEGGTYNQRTVFELSPKDKETVLYSFAGGNDGDQPLGGALVGTTNAGGANNLGTIYKISKNGETVLHSFGGTGDGGKPFDAPIRDKAGNLYGTTAADGANGEGGIVFKLAPDGTYTILHSFCAAANCADGEQPLGGLLLDSAGNLYGTTRNGGAYNGGTVFKVTPGGTETVLYSFCAATDCTDGGFPYAGVIGDPATGLCGTTQQGGATNNGEVFELAPDGTETVLHSFDQTDGDYPQAPLLMDKKGNLYGTTTGTDGNEGSVFEISP